ncbi:hypothetical protein I7412_01375, partial [Frankia sp. CN6]|nr:hypothetical protein [Frankia nepalensis]
RPAPAGGRPAGRPPREADEREREAEGEAAAERDALDEAATARAGQRAAQERAAAGAQSLAAAVGTGLLPAQDQPGLARGAVDPAVATGSLAEVVATAAADAAAAAAAVREALAEVSRLDRERTGAADAAHRAERAADAARGRAAALAEQLTAADDAAAAITADGRIAALLGLAAGPPPARDGARLAGHDPAWDDFPVRRASPLPDGAGAVGLDGVTEDALAALRAAVAAGEERRLALTVAADEDRRVLAALDADELRPARPEVVTVRAALAEAGIPAEPGWSYLARAVPAGAREAALRRRPDLADGVVLTGADVPLGRARDVLLAARLLPDAAVTVGTPAAFAGPAEADVFVVPPNPALYDTEAAAADRRAIEARARDRSLLTARLGESIETDRALAAALAGWRRAHPPGRAGALAAELAAARAAADAAAGASAAATAQARAAQAAADTALTAVEPLRAAEHA